MSTAERLDELRNRFTENPRRYFASLANELRKTGNPDEAIAICRRLLPTLPGHMSGYIVLGQSLYETERLDEARAVFEEALGHDPENLIALRHLGDIDRRQGNAAAARRWYERVLEADPRNDDIATHLMKMGTPVAAVPVPPIAAEAIHVPAPILETTHPVDAHSEVPVPESVVPEVAVPEEPLAIVGQPSAEDRPVLDPADDPFGFGVPLEDVLKADEPFEEGLLASAWPDISALEARRSGERPVVPVGEGVAESPPVRPAPPDVVAAFGAEAHESVPLRMPGDGQPWITEPPRKTREVEVIAEAIAEDARASGEPDGVAVFAHPAPDHAEVTPFSDVHPELEDAVGVSESLPAETDAPVHAVAEFESEVLGEAVAGTEADVPAALGTVATVEAGVEAEADVMAEVVAEGVAAVEADGTPAPAMDSFATETMGELLASQGLVDQAIGVYEALVRHRPGDVALTARLDDLRARRDGAPASAAGRWRTARERFGALAARQRRRTAPVAEAVAEPVALVAEPGADAGPLAPTIQMAAVLEPSRPVTPFTSSPAIDSTQRSLASLFGSPTAEDEAAASTLAGIFGGASPEPVEGSGTTAWLDALGALPSQTVPEPRAPTPWGASPVVEAPEPLGFDHAFPDPGRAPAEPVVDPQTANDLAEFSAWLKGLGSP